MFGSLMQQAIPAAQGGESGPPLEGQQPGQAAAGAAPTPSGAVGPQPVRDNTVDE